MKLITTRKVTASMSDADANLSVIGAFQFSEDGVTELMGELKIDGVTAKKVYNAIWVFAKSKIKLLKSVEWNEEFTVTSYISKISHTLIDIDVAFNNSSGELFACSRTQICALDAESGKIRKVSTVGVDENFTVEQPLFDISFTKFNHTDLREVDKVKIRYTNIDYAQHTNNKEYVRFMLNTYSLSEMKSRPIKQIELAYINQSYESEELSVCKKELDVKDAFVIFNGEKTVVKCEMIR